MSENKCKCDLRTKLVGDGCRYCNPQDYIDHLHDALAAHEWVGLTDEDIAAVLGFNQHTTEATKMTLTCVVQAIEAKLREKNGG